jgi:hypothetical protein
MALEDSTVHQMLNALTVTHVSLHSVVAPAGGASELTGHDYGRLPMTLAAAAARKRLLSADAVFNLGPGHAPKAIGFWNNAAFLGYSTLSLQPTIVVDDATYTCPAATTGLQIP